MAPFEAVAPPQRVYQISACSVLCSVIVWSCLVDGGRECRASAITAPEGIGPPGGEAGAIGSDASDRTGDCLLIVDEAPDEQAAAIVLDLLCLADQRLALFDVGQCGSGRST